MSPIFIDLLHFLSYRTTGKKHESEELLFEDLGTYEMGSVQSRDFQNVKLEELPLFTYESLLKATGNFHSKNKLGKGGFGEVYKVIMQILFLAATC